jgi:hypothetical protein
MSTNGISVANYFIDLANRDSVDLRQYGLIKRVYITHGISLAYFDRPALDPRAVIHSVSADASLKEGNVADQSQKRSHRERYADKIFYLMLVFLSLSWITVWLSGIGILDFHVPSEVLITLQTSTAVEVIGLFALVVKYVFR